MQELIEFLLTKDILWLYANLACVLSILGGVFFLVCAGGYFFKEIFIPKNRRW